MSEETVSAELLRLDNENARLRIALQLIAAPRRPDGTWNRDREACRQIAIDALREREVEA